MVDDEKRPFVQIELTATASRLFLGNDPNEYNLRLSQRRIDAIREYTKAKYREFTGRDLRDEGKPLFIENPRGQVEDEDTDEVSEISEIPSKIARRTNFIFTYNGATQTVEVPISDKEREDLNAYNTEIAALDTEIARLQNRSANVSGCDFTPYTIRDGIAEKYVSNGTSREFKFKPVFHSQTPEDFHRRLTFLQQCMRQGKNIDNSNNTNSVFGRQPVSVLRIGDFFHTKIMIENLAIDYSVDVPWDLNPEGMGVQPMLADVDMKVKVIGGQSLATPISALQNAISFNYYANSTFYNGGTYNTPTNNETEQLRDNNIENNE